MKKLGFIFGIFFFACSLSAQQNNCILQPSQFTIHFGSGNISDVNSGGLSEFRRVSHSCPSDGYYSYAPYTSRCFHDDWHTLPEDHTAGDAGGNMLLVNAVEGMFLRTPVRGLKSNTMYELGVWLLNLCKPTNKCPYPLLPRLNIRLETDNGTVIANIVTGEVPRFADPRWVQHRAFFTTPGSTSPLMLVMVDNSPRGCGNDFALDDITFRECVKKIAETPKAIPKTNPTKARPPAATKQTVKNTTTPTKKDVQQAQVIKPKSDTISKTVAAIKHSQKLFPPPPLVLKTRENALARKIETEAGEIRIDLYDNGQIDDDTVSIYHNNALIKSKMRLSQRPISLTITVDPSQPHHEMVMVAENLGSIPPNTSVMIITTARNRYEVFISSTEQKNAKVVFDLKK